MILTRANFEVAVACSTDATRPALHHIKVDKDGTTVATNGYVLFRIGPSDQPIDDFPIVKDHNGKQVNCHYVDPPKNCLIPKETAQVILKELKSRRRNAIPVLRMAELTTNKDKSKMLIVTTDLDKYAIHPLPDSETTGIYPKYKKVIPPRLEVGEPVASINLSTSLLRKVVDFVSATSASSEACVTLTFFKKALSPVHFDGGKTQDGQAIDGYIMPRKS